MQGEQVIALRLCECQYSLVIGEIGMPTAVSGLYAILKLRQELDL